MHKVISPPWVAFTTRAIISIHASHACIMNMAASAHFCDGTQLQALTRFVVRSIAGAAWTMLELTSYVIVRPFFLRLLDANPRAGDIKKKAQTATQMLPRLVCFVHNSLQASVQQQQQQAAKRMEGVITVATASSAQPVMTPSICILDCCQTTACRHFHCPPSLQIPAAFVILLSQRYYSQRMWAGDSFSRGVMAISAGCAGGCVNDLSPPCDLTCMLLLPAQYSAA